MVKFSRWVKISEEKTDKNGNLKNVKRTIRNQYELTLKELKADLTARLEKFLLHSFRDYHQMMTLKEKRGNLHAKEIYIWVDFSENYECKYEHEIQSHFYGASKEQVTLHTGVVFLKEEFHTFCTASRAPGHDPAAIYAHRSQGW